MAHSAQSTVPAVQRTRAWLGWNQHLILVVTLPLLLLLVLGGLAFQHQRLADSTLRTVIEDRLLPLQHIKTVADAYAVELVDVTHKARDGTLQSDEAARRAGQAREAADRAWQDYLQTFLIADERRLIAQAEPRLGAARRMSWRLQSLLAAGDGAAVAELAARQLYPTIDPLSAILRELADVQEAESRRLLEAATERFDRLRLTLAAGGLVSGLIVALLTWHWTRGTLRGMARANRLADAIAGRRLDDSSRPASGAAGPQELMRALDGIRNEMRDNERLFEQLLALLPLPTLVWDPRQDRVVDVGAQTLLSFGGVASHWRDRALHALPLWEPGQEDALRAWSAAWRFSEPGAQTRLQAWVSREGGERERHEVGFLLHAPSGRWLLSLRAVEALSAAGPGKRARPAPHDAGELLGREGFERVLEQAVQSWQRRGQAFGLAVLRVAGLAELRARHGEDAVERCWNELARRVRDTTRDTDCLARWSEDTMAWLLSDTAHPAAALQAAQRVAAVTNPAAGWPTEPIAPGAAPCTSRVGLVHVAEFGPVQAAAVFARACARAERGVPGGGVTASD